MSRMKNKRWPLLIIVLVVIGAAAFGFWRMLRKSQTATGQTSKTTQNTAAPTGQPPTSVRLIATGDWIAHDSVNTAAKRQDGTYDYLPLVQDFAPLFKKADIRFCNDPILNGGAALGIHGYPKFNSPTEFVTSMGALGCNLVNTASNHSFDFSQANITASVQAWDKVPNMLAVAGQNSDQAGHDTIHYFTINGVKFAFLAYTTYINSDAPAQNSYGVNVFSRAFAAQQIAAAKQAGAQEIIVSMRWGTEYSTNFTAQQQTDAQFLADQGVGLVLGHGSHELQPVAQLTGAGGTKTIVWYSLGNFLNTQEPPETLFNGIAALDYNIATKQWNIKGYLPIYMHYEWTAVQAASDAIATRHSLHLYLAEDATQDMLDSQQLHTTLAVQKQRITTTLNKQGLSVPLLSSKDL